MLGREFRGRFAAALGSSFLLVAAACSSNPEPAVSSPKMVSIGYGTQDESSVTGAISSINGNDVKSHHFTTVVDMIEGRVPGVQVIRRGNDASLQIRGITSLNGPTEPLIVIDGVETPQFLSAGLALAAVNPNDVERIDVLKDAGSTAIYGMRGANGVIVITTKRGR